jgi:hypothetical protein
MTQTAYNLKRKGRYINRLPVSALIYVCDNKRGWVGWCPLNNLWCAAVWSCGYTMIPTLRQALDHIKWHEADKTSRSVPPVITRFREVFEVGDFVPFLVILT